MTPEQSQPPAPRRPYEQFGFTEPEYLFNRVSQTRFEEILNDSQSIIHKIDPSSNEYSEFLFVTISHPADRGRIGMTFYGLGYHEQRECWITEEWFWYQSEFQPDVLKQKVVKEEAKDVNDLCLYL